MRAGKAAQAVADLLPDMQRRRGEGQSYGAIAAALNEAGQRTVRGGQWNATQVKRALDRAGSA